MKFKSYVSIWGFGMRVLVFLGSVLFIAPFSFLDFKN